MRKVNFYEYINKTKSEKELIYKNIPNEKTIRKRLRDSSEEEILLKLDKMRFERLIKEGVIEIIGPRRYKINVERYK
ncbi:hypothetical protein [Thermoanaerobacter wiegelii]|uniref:Uncharacterized protein n=1 Tax=Thermoanaerobacter wiegelii Rt8.B1 TaxID=697303 RepID=G2MRZ8_9THEO|nr:hypothetical protein [Thermoanaerobacter wiegelii]AEM77744.1 hypothetical protein Thewi_0242 [Thermoanaerobacter wiegelii Rt8.B1]